MSLCGDEGGSQMFLVKGLHQATCFDQLLQRSRALILVAVLLKGSICVPGMTFREEGKGCQSEKEIILFSRLPCWWMCPVKNRSVLQPKSTDQCN